MSVDSNPDHPPIPRLVVMLVVSIVAFSLLNAILLSVLSDPSLPKLVQRGNRFLLTCALAYFLFRGASWARWVAILLTALAATFSIVSVITFPAAGSFFVRAWMGVMAAFYGSVACLLLFAPSVVSHFTRRRLPAPPQQ